MSIILRPCIGIDPGARWSGVVAVDERGRVLNGGTVGPRNRQGELEPDRLDAVFKSDPGKFVGGVRSYTLQLVQFVDELAAFTERVTGQTPAIGIERYTYNHRVMAGTRWLIPLLVVHGLAVHYPAAKLVTPESVTDTSTYPFALRGRPPEGWMMTDEPNNRRNHEQSAWSVATAVQAALGSGAR
jgi:hypothetical protein